MATTHATAPWPAAEVVKTSDWTSPIILLSGARVGIAVAVSTVVAAVPVTSGAPVGVKSAAHKEDSAVKITVEITLAAGAIGIGARDSGGAGKRILLLFHFHHEQCEDKWE